MVVALLKVPWIFIISGYIVQAKCSDVSVTPHPLKVLYAFAIHRLNWRKAASYMYLYSTRLKSEASGREYEFRSFALQERLNCLSATINALHLLSPNCAWINTSYPGKSIWNESHLSIKAR